MPFTELIRVTCDECAERLWGPEVGDLHECHRAAVKAATGSGWYVDAQTVRCPDHWPGHYSVAPVREESTPSPADEGQIVPITDCEEG